jgi:PPOX class probable F420-dependent enzyme
MLTSEQEAYVQAGRLARLATVDERGRPHVVPVCYVYDGTYFYTAIDRKRKSAPTSDLRRIKNLVANPNVALLVDHYSENWDELSYVQVRGQAALVTSGEESERAVAALRGKYPQYETLLADDATVIRIEPRRAMSWTAIGELGRT